MPRIIKPQAACGSKVVSYKHAALEMLSSNGSNGAESNDPAAIMARAREEAEQKVHEAYAEGMRRGLEAGEKKFSESIGQAAELLESASEVIQSAHDEFLTALEPQLAKLATSIASKIIEHETQIAPEIVQRTARSVIERVLDEERVVLRANPQDVAALREFKITLLEEFKGIQQLEVQADETIDPGGCIAVTENLTIDGRIASQLEEILNAMIE